MNVSRRERRKKVPDKPNLPLNLWSVMKNCIGKELTKIPMPVNFSEPLSMLQRLTEDFEYSEILDQASKCTDSCEQLCFVAAFTVSSYATTAVRILSFLGNLYCFVDFYASISIFSSTVYSFLIHFLFTGSHWKAIQSAIRRNF